MDKTTINDRLRRALELADDVKQADIARELGFTSASVSLWFSEGSRRSTPDIQTLSRLAKMLKVSLQWLASGEGQMRADVSRPALPTDPLHETYGAERRQILALIDGLGDEQRKALIVFLRTIL